MKHTTTHGKNKHHTIYIRAKTANNTNHVIHMRRQKQQPSTYRNIIFVECQTQQTATDNNTYFIHIQANNNKQHFQAHHLYTGTQTTNNNNTTYIQ